MSTIEPDGWQSTKSDFLVFVLSRWRLELPAKAISKEVLVHDQSGRVAGRFGSTKNGSGAWQWCGLCRALVAGIV